MCSGWKVTRAPLLLSPPSEVTSVLCPWASDIMVYENVALPGSHRKVRGIFLGKRAYKMIRTLSLSPIRQIKCPLMKSIFMVYIKYI